MKIIVTFGMIVLIITTITGLGYLTTVNADKDKDKDFCYDQVGDGHMCFAKEKHCEKDQKNDEIAESPCYNQDRT
jgi:hypothetical protein